MKVKRSILIPIVLLAYLAVMSTMGWKQYQSGQIGALYFYGVVCSTLVVIVLLHFSLKRRERLRRERLDDISRQANDDNSDKTT